MFASKGSPSRFVIVKVKSVGQFAADSVDVTSRSEKVCTFTAASIVYVYGLDVKVEEFIDRRATKHGSTNVMTNW